MLKFTKEEINWFHKELVGLRPHLKYPIMHLNKVKLRWADLGEISGKYNWWTNTIILNENGRGNLPWMFGTLLHELRHAFQYKKNCILFFITNNPLLRWIQHRECHAVEKQGNSHIGKPDLNPDI